MLFEVSSRLKWRQEGRRSATRSSYRWLGRSAQAFRLRKNPLDNCRSILCICNHYRPSQLLDVSAMTLTGHLDNPFALYRPVTLSEYNPLWIVQYNDLDFQISQHFADLAALRLGRRKLC